MTDAELQGLVRQASRYYVAGEQDANPVVAHLHYNYAYCLFEAAHQGASRARIRRVTGVEIDRALAAARRAQEFVQQMLLKCYPVEKPAWAHARQTAPPRRQRPPAAAGGPRPAFGLLGARA